MFLLIMLQRPIRPHVHQTPIAFLQMDVIVHQKVAAAMLYFPFGKITAISEL